MVAVSVSDVQWKRVCLPVLQAAQRCRLGTANILNEIVEVILAQPYVIKPIVSSLQAFQLQTPSEKPHSREMVDRIWQSLAMCKLDTATYPQQLVLLSTWRCPTWVLHPQPFVDIFWAWCTCHVSCWWSHVAHRPSKNVKVVSSPSLGFVFNHQPLLQYACLMFRPLVSSTGKMVDRIWQSLAMCKLNTATYPQHLPTVADDVIPSGSGSVGFTIRLSAKTAGTSNNSRLLRMSCILLMISCCSPTLPECQSGLVSVPGLCLQSSTTASICLLDFSVSRISRRQNGWQDMTKFGHVQILILRAVLAVLNPRWSRSNMWVCLHQNPPPIKTLACNIQMASNWIHTDAGATMVVVHAAQIFYKHGGSADDVIQSGSRSVGFGCPLSDYQSRPTAHTVGTRFDMKTILFLVTEQAKNFYSVERSLRNDLQSKSFKLAQWQETRLFSCRNACQHQWWQIIRTSSAAAEIDKPLRAQSKSPDVYSRIRECVRNCQCNAINLNQTCHMNSLCNQRSGCLPLASKSCFCCSETQNTCLTSWYWVWALTTQYKM